MNKLLWLALPALALTACHKAPETAQSGAASDTGAMAADSAESVTPAGGVPTMVPSDAASDAQAADAPANTAATYLAKAGAGDLFEVESSRAVLKTTQDPKIQLFAKTMIADHEESTTMLKGAAKEAKVTVPAPHLMPDQQQSLDAIKTAKGQDADHVYLGAQRDAHAAALNLHKTYAANGDTPQLKTVAGKIVPVVEHHIAMLDKMSG